MSGSVKRNRIMLSIVKGIIWPLIKTTSVKEYEIPEETQQIIRNRNSTIMYISPHKSLWETIGIPYTISKHGGDTPFVFMGNNLLKKETGLKEQIIKYVVEQIGGVSIERENNPRAKVQTLIDSISNILGQGNNVMIFPEGTRSRDGLVKQFKPASFQGAIDANNQGKDIQIIPINIDYSNLIELKEFMAEQSSKYTFSVNDSRKWKETKLGHIYISLGAPIKVDKTYDRKELAQKVREECLDLIKIQPINILSTAIKRINPISDADLEIQRIYKEIENVLTDLEFSRYKYRGFDSTTPPEEILAKSNISIDTNLIKGYNIYANNIAHYLNKK